MTETSRIRIALRLPEFRLELSAEWDARVVAVYGPSGSGKTSLLEILAGIRRADDACILLNGRTLEDSARGVRLSPEQRGLGWVPQDASLFPHLSVDENLRFGLPRAGEAGQMQRAIEMFEIGHLLDRRPGELSGGERQRVSCARALASGPKGLLLDEPLASLDLPLRARIFPYLLRLRDSAALPMIYVTHDASEALALATHVLVLDQGRLVASGAPDDLLRSPAALRLLDLIRLENCLMVDAVTPIEGGELILIRTRGGVELSLPLGPAPRPGELVRIRSEEILIASGAVDRVSARNQIGGVIETISEQAGRCLVTVRCSDERLRATITAQAKTRLHLAPGSTVTLIFKAHAIHRLGDSDRLAGADG